MTTEDFISKFNLFANTPNAAMRVRELILELAMQGRLVPQDRLEESANVQLLRIIAQKAKTRPIERSKARGNLVNESQTVIPYGWVLTSLSDLVTILNGRAYAKDELLSEGVPVLRVGNLFTSKHWYYSNLELEPDKYCDKGDLIYAWSASFGPFIWSGPKVIYHYHIWKLVLHSESDLDKAFMFWFLQNKTQEIKRSGHGVSMLHMTKEKMEKLEVTLPPLAEQKRIVAKVDELMALCDQLEAQQQERERRFPVLSRTCHVRFAEEPTLANLNRIFDETGSLAPRDLRRTILTLAVKGQLVRSRESKSIVLDEVIELISGQHLLANEQNDQKRGIPYLTGPADFGANEPTPSRWTETPKVVAEPGDILITVKGAGVGKTNKLSAERTAISRQLMAVRVTGADPEFVHLVLRNAAEHFQSSMTGIAIPGIGRKDVLGLEASLPTLAEQRIAVVKVNELMVLVDQLEVQQQERDKLAEAFAKACVASFTGTTQIKIPEKMKAPKTQLLSIVTIGKRAKPNAHAPLAQLLTQHKGTLPAKSLWQQSGLTIDAFYQQLKAELVEGWIAPPKEAEMKVLEEA